MAAQAKLYNRARVSTSTTGTGTLTLGAATSNAFFTFAESGVGNGEVVTYIIENGADVEVGRGTYTSAGTTLSRDTVLISKSGGTAGTSKLNLTGTSTVYIAAAAQDYWALLPIGAILPYGGATEPPKFLFGYGQNVSRTTYADLFTVYGTTYGAGDGLTTFGLPDLRGRVVAGQDDMGGTSANRLTGLTGGVDGDVLGGTGGSQSHTQTTAEMPTHDHSLADIVRGDGGGGDVVADNAAGVGASTTSAGGGGAHNNVQPTIILNYIIYAGA
jgi:microcystin-dependent protein